MKSPPWLLALTACAAAFAAVAQAETRYVSEDGTGNGASAQDPQLWSSAFDALYDPNSITPHVIVLVGDVDASAAGYEGAASGALLGCNTTINADGGSWKLTRPFVQYNDWNGECGPLTLGANVTVENPRFLFADKQTCGNGALELTETCDPGHAFNSSFGYVECANCNEDVSRNQTLTAPPGGCNNGVVEQGEYCDPDVESVNANPLGVCNSACTGFVANPTGGTSRASDVGINDYPTISPHKIDTVTLTPADTYIDVGFAYTSGGQGTSIAFEIDFCDADQEKSMWWARIHRDEVVAKDANNGPGLGSSVVALPDGSLCTRYRFDETSTIRTQGASSPRQLRVYPASDNHRAQIQGTLHMRIRVVEEFNQDNFYRYTRRTVAHVTRDPIPAPAVTGSNPADILERDPVTNTASATTTFTADAQGSKWHQSRLFFNIMGSAGNFQTQIGKYTFTEMTYLPMNRGLFFDSDDAVAATNDDFQIPFTLTPDYDSVDVMRFTISTSAASRFHTGAPDPATTDTPVAAAITPVPKLTHFSVDATPNQSGKTRGASVQIVDAGAGHINATDAFTKIRSVKINGFPTTNGATVSAPNASNIAGDLVTYDFVAQTQDISYSVCSYRSEALSNAIDVTVRRDNGEPTTSTEYRAVESTFTAVTTIESSYITDALDAKFIHPTLTSEDGFTATFDEAASTTVGVLASDVNQAILDETAQCQLVSHEQKKPGTAGGRIVDVSGNYLVDVNASSNFVEGQACSANTDEGISTNHKCWAFDPALSAITLKSDDLYAICNTTAPGDTLKVCVTTVNTVDGTASPNEQEHCVDWNAMVTPKAYIGTIAGAAAVSFAEGASTTYTITGDLHADAKTAGTVVTDTTQVEVFARKNNADLIATFGAGAGNNITAEWTSLGTATGTSKAVVINLATLPGDNFAQDADALQFKTQTTVCHGETGAQVAETTILDVPVTVTPVANPCQISWDSTAIIRMNESESFITPITVPYSATRQFTDEDLQITVSASGAQNFSCYVNGNQVAGTPANTCVFTCANYTNNDLKCGDTLEIGPGTNSAFDNFDIVISAQTLHATPDDCDVFQARDTRTVEITPKTRPGTLAWAAAPTPHGSQSTFTLTLDRGLHENSATGHITLTVQLDSAAEVSGDGNSCNVAHYSIANGGGITWASSGVASRSIDVSVTTLRPTCAASCVLTFSATGITPDPTTTHLNDPGTIQVTIQNDPGVFAFAQPVADLTTVIEGAGVSWSVDVSRSLNGFATVPAVNLTFVRDNSNDGSQTLTALKYNDFSSHAADATFAWAADENQTQTVTFTVNNDESFSHMRCAAFALKLASGADFCALPGSKTLCITDDDSAGWETSSQAQILEFHLASSIGPVAIEANGNIEIAFSAPYPSQNTIPAGTFPFAYIAADPITAADIASDSLPACSSLATGVASANSFLVDMAAGSCSAWAQGAACNASDCPSNFAIDTASSFGACSYSTHGAQPNEIQMATWKFQSSLSHAVSTCAGVTAAFSNEKTIYTIPAHIATIFKTHPNDPQSTHMTVQNTDKTVALSVFNSIQASAAILEVLEANVFAITADYEQCSSCDSNPLGPQNDCSTNNPDGKNNFRLKITVTVDAKDTDTSFRAIISDAHITPKAGNSNCYGFPATGQTNVSHTDIGGDYTRTTVTMYTACINTQGANNAFATCAADSTKNHDYGFRFQTTRCSQFDYLAANHASCITNDANDIAITLRFEDSLPTTTANETAIAATADLWHTTGATRIGVGSDPTFTNDETIGVSIRLNDHAAFPASFDMRVKTAAIAEVVLTGTEEQKSNTRAQLLARGLFQADGITLDRYYWVQQGQNAPFTSERFFVKEGSTANLGNFAIATGSHCKNDFAVCTGYATNNHKCAWDMDTSPGVDSTPHNTALSTWDAFQFPSNLLSAKEYIVSVVAEVQDCAAATTGRRLLQTSYTVVANSSNGAFVVTNSVDTYALNYDQLPTSAQIAGEEEGWSGATIAAVVVGSVLVIGVIAVAFTWTSSPLLLVTSEISLDKKPLLGARAQTKPHFPPQSRRAIRSSLC